MNEKTIVFTGGGTAGHVFPGLAVIDEMAAQWDGNVAWIGSGDGMERDIVEKAGIPFYSIRSGKLRRYFSLRNLSDIFNIVAGFFMAWVLLVRFKPAVLFSKGGYVSVPVVAAARLLKIFTVTHESDSTPGLANKINSRMVHRIFVSFDITREYFPETVRNKVVVTGNPVRRGLFSGSSERARSELRFHERLPVVLVLGGSQGALQINRLIEEIKPRLTEHCYVIHQTGRQAGDRTGKQGGKEIESRTGKQGGKEIGSRTGNERVISPENDRYRAFPFIGEELRDYFAAADIVVGRAGANTLWEIGTLGKPSVLIPLAGAATRGDQVKNAEEFRSRGAAVVLTGGEVTADNLYRNLSFLIDHPEKREEMGRRAASICERDANKAITEFLLGELRNSS